MSEYLVLRIDPQDPNNNLSDTIICSHQELLNKLNELTQSKGEYAYGSIPDIINSYEDYGAMVIIDLGTRNFIIE